MGEIKSTLDIIMEKARRIAVTDEEKEAFQRKEAEGKIRGLLQKFLDGFMDMETLKRDLHAFPDKYGRVAKGFLKNECLGRIDPEKDNSALLQVIEAVEGADIKALRKMLDQFRKDMEQHLNEREKELLRSLKKSGISGSAVIPNIRADHEWRGYVSQRNRVFREELRNRYP